MLKCRYLAQFSVNELKKNANIITTAAGQCPFMMHVKKSFSTLDLKKNENNNHKKVNETSNIKEHLDSKLECTNTISCPFFKSTGKKLENLLVKKNMEELDNGDCLISKTTNEVFEISNKSLKFDLKHVNSKMKKKELLNSNNKLVTKSKEKIEKFNYDDYFGKKIEEKKKDGSYRQFKKIVRHADTFPLVKEHNENGFKNVTIWCSNDYLGLGRHPYVKSKIVEAIKKFGAGSGGTRNISGSTPLHVELEQELAKLHQKESALLFTSCYVANDTTLFTMSKMLPECHILSDSGNHASMIQGIRNSGVPKSIFRHNDLEHLEESLKSLSHETPKIVAFETVHSMDGSICETEKMCDITHKYGGIAFIDEVHAVGLYGKNGGGIGERDNVLNKMDIISGTLGKAFGNIGGYIAGSSNFVDAMRSFGSGFIFTTSLPPSVAAGALASIEISRSNEGRELRAKHQLNASIVKRELIDAGLPVFNTPSHIVPVMVGNAKTASEICDRLMNEYGIYIQSINYPTVARGEERIRIVPNPYHTPEMIEKLISSLVEVWVKSGLKLNKQEKKIK